MKKLFTTESVSEGHPDKIADAISDLVVTMYLQHDNNARVACETLVTENTIVLAGEINTFVDIDKSLLDTKILDYVRYLGYDYEGSGFEPDKIIIDNKLHNQSSDISMGVDIGGAGDQGMMFGYACNETEHYLPKQSCYTHEILKKLRKYVGNGAVLPDAKSQITFEYRDGKPIHVDTILISQQNTEASSEQDFKMFIKQDIIDRVFYNEPMFDNRTKILINPTGRFVIGGPYGDTGLTGRKIIVDTYGGFGYHGGGAFSGKDPSKVDRSASYMARWLAKQIVHKGFCDVCNVQLAYAIGVAEPVSIDVFDNKGNTLYDAIRFCRTIDLTPKGIIDRFGLKTVDYNKYCNYSHFYHKTAPWEVV